MLTSEIVQSGVSDSSALLGRSISPVIIMQKQSRAPKENVVQFLQSSIKSWYWCNRGDFKTSFVLQQDLVSMDDKVGVSIVTDWINLKNSAKDLKISLMRTITIKTRVGDSKTMTHTLKTYTVKRFVQSLHEIGQISIVDKI